MERSVYTVNAVLFALVLVGIGIFDATLELGDLQGAVFTLWTLYAGAAFLLVNGVLAGVMAARDRPVRPYAVCAVAVPLVAVLVAALASAVLG